MLAWTHTVLHEEKRVDALDTIEHGRVRKMLLCIPSLQMKKWNGSWQSDLTVVPTLGSGATQLRPAARWLQSL